MPSYLYAVQDDNGREVVSAHVDVEKVSDVEAHRQDGNVQLRFEDVVIEETPYDVDSLLTLFRWPSDAKLADAVERPVK